LPNLSFFSGLYTLGQPASAWLKDRKQLSSKQEVKIAEHVFTAEHNKSSAVKGTA